MEKYIVIARTLRVRNAELKKRIKRCEYLRHRAKLMLKCKNREQAQAYACRINWHKPKLLETLEAIEKLETRLKDMSSLWAHNSAS